MRWISLINKLFSDINISQGSVATHLRCGGIFNECCNCKFSGDYNSERIFLNLPIFDEVVCRAFEVHFFGPPCILLEIY